MCRMYVCMYVRMYAYVCMHGALGRDLVHSVLSLSMATSLEEDLVATPTAGFLLV